MPAIAMIHEQDPKALLLARVGDLSGVEVFNNQVMVAIYLRPEKTAGGIILTQTNRDEDKTQGKVGLIIKKGSEAFKSDAKWTFPDVDLHDWIYFRASDGWAITLPRGGANDAVACRILEDTNVRGRVQHPDEVW